jgi:uncharacterized DUF497 family protein
LAKNVTKKIRGLCGHNDVDARYDYGEERRIVIGGIGDDILAVVYTFRQDVIRLGNYPLIY